MTAKGKRVLRLAAFAFAFAAFSVLSAVSACSVHVIVEANIVSLEHIAVGDRNLLQVSFSRTAQHGAQVEHIAVGDGNLVKVSFLNTDMVKVGINGFGRIGRLTFRYAFDMPEVEVVRLSTPPPWCSHRLCASCSTHCSGPRERAAGWGGDGCLPD